MTKNHVETYSPSKAAASGPEEKAQNHYKLKEKVCVRTARLPLNDKLRLRQGLNGPKQSHNHPRTSNQCRQ